MKVIGFVCHICDVSFTQSVALSSHHHSETCGIERRSFAHVPKTKIPKIPKSLPFLFFYLFRPFFLLTKCFTTHHSVNSMRLGTGQTPLAECSRGLSKSRTLGNLRREHGGGLCVRTKLVRCPSNGCSWAQLLPGCQCFGDICITRHIAHWPGPSGLPCQYLMGYIASRAAVVLYIHFHQECPHAVCSITGGNTNGLFVNSCV